MRHRYIERQPPDEQPPIPKIAMTTMRAFFPQQSGYVYVLRLEGGRFYVGYSQDVSRRLRQHFTGNGAAWTKLHRPVEVVEVAAGGKADERDKTLEIMRKHGWMVTRGHAWTARTLRAPPRELWLT